MPRTVLGARDSKIVQCGFAFEREVIQKEKETYKNITVILWEVREMHTWYYGGTKEADLS